MLTTIIKATKRNFISHIPTKHTSKINSAYISTDEKQIVTGSDDKTIKLWDVNSGMCIRTYLGHESRIISVSFSDDEKYIISICDNNIIKWFYKNTGQCIKSYKANNSNLTCYSEINKFEYQHPFKKLVKRLENFIFGKRLRGFEKGYGEIIFSNLNNKSIIRASINHIELWDTKRFKLLQNFEDDLEYIKKVIANDKYIAIEYSNYDIKIWDINQKKFLKSFYPTFNTLLTFTKDNKLLIFGSCESYFVIWDIENNKHKKIKYCSNIDSSSIILFNNIIERSDKKYLVFREHDSLGDIKMMDIYTGKVEKVFKGHKKNGLHSIELSKDGRYLITGSWDASAILWNFESCELIKTFSNHKISVSNVSITHDNKYIITESHGEYINIWDTKSGDCIDRLYGFSFKLMKNSYKIIYLNNNYEAIVYSIKNNKVVQKLKHNSISVDSLLLTSCGKYFIIKNKNAIIDIYGLKQNKLLYSLYIFKENLTSELFTNNGSYLLINSKLMQGSKRYINKYFR